MLVDQKAASYDERVSYRGTTLPKMPQACGDLSTIHHKFVNFIKLQQLC